MQPAASNGWATAGLIFGILPTPLLGIIFSIIGLVRAAKVRVGKGRSWVGLILSVLWMIGSIVLVIALAASPAVKKAVQRADPGCVQFESTDANAFTSKIQADAGDPTKLQADLQDMQNQIKSSADKAVNPTAKAAMQKFSSDFQELLDDLNSGTVPSADLQTRLSTDGAAVDTACGH
jgi:hypothetical protein